MIDYDDDILINIEKYESDEMTASMLLDNAACEIRQLRREVSDLLRSNYVSQHRLEVEKYRKKGRVGVDWHPQRREK